MTTGHARRVLALVVLSSVTGATGAPVAGQERDPSFVVRPDTAATVVGPGVSPLGAFLRSLAIPGWGHAAAGSYRRGGIYFTAQATAGFMLYKTSVFLDRAQHEQERAEQRVEARLRAAGQTDPDSIFTAIEADEDVETARELVGTREQQSEDWLSVAVFIVLMSGADAFVSAHLQNLPEPLSVQVVPDALQPRVEIQYSIPWQGPGGG